MKTIELIVPDHCRIVTATAICSKFRGGDIDVHTKAFDLNDSEIIVLGVSEEELLNAE